MKTKPFNSRPGFRGFRLIILGSLIGVCGGNSSVLADGAPVLPPLTSVSGNPRLPGKFVWADLVTDDVSVASKFYQSLFGWTFRSTGNYLIAANNERPLCGMFQKPRPEGRNAKPRWFGYLSIGNVEKAQKTVSKLGGQVLAPAQKFPKRGEQAVFSDPEGAVFGVVKSSAGDPEDFLADPGDWIWIQLLSRDASRAAKFYSQVGGFDALENSQTNRLSDFVLTSRGYARATVRTIPKQDAQVDPGWLLFVRVTNVVESAAQAKQLGGKVLLDPKPELLQGKVAVVADPTGAPIGLLQWSEELLQKGR